MGDRAGGRPSRVGHTTPPGVPHLDGIHIAHRDDWGLLRGSHLLAWLEIILAAAEGDVVFSCVDTLEARQLCDFISSAFLLPLFDVGVVIPVRGEHDLLAIADVCGRVDYVQPGGSTLRDRGVWNPEALRAEYLRRAAPRRRRIATSSPRATSQAWLSRLRRSSR